MNSANRVPSSSFKDDVTCLLDLNSSIPSVFDTEFPFFLDHSKTLPG